MLTKPEVEIYISQVLKDQASARTKINIFSSIFLVNLPNDCVKEDEQCQNICGKTSIEIIDLKNKTGNLSSIQHKPSNLPKEHKTRL